MATYYMSTTGNDGTGDGSIGSPWKTIEHSSAQLNPGDTLYIRGGTHRSAKADTIVNRFYINGMNGSSGNIITISNYPGETVVFNCDDVYVPGTAGDGPVGFKVENCSWFHIKGIRVTGLEQNPANINSPCGFIVYDSDDWTIERLDVDNIEGYGFYVQGTKNPGGIGCHRGLVLNCDVHDVGDVHSGWGGANGFQCTGADLSDDITFRGCRAWRCSDDGFDLYSVDGVFKFENCWAFWNGYQPNVDPLTTAGDGMGFKLGPNDSDQSGTIKKYLHKCLSFENRRFGFDQNVSGAPTCQYQVYNCVAYDNKDNQSFFFGGDTGINQTFKNNVALLPTTVNGSEITSGPNVSNNTWNGGVTVTTADFISVDSTGVDGPRQSDGSLPILDFLRPTAGSDLIDAGVDVGLDYLGSNPDMGAFEFGEETTTTTTTSTSSTTTTTTAYVGTGEINLNSVTFACTPPSSQTATVEYKLSSEMDWIVYTTTATILSDGSFSPEITITNLLDGECYDIRVTVPCSSYEKEFCTDTTTTTTTTSTTTTSTTTTSSTTTTTTEAPEDEPVNYQNGLNIAEDPPGTWNSLNGTTKFCGFSTSEFPASEACYYYCDYVDGNSDYVALALSTSVLSDCDNVPFDSTVFLSPQVASEYRVYDGVDGFQYTGVTAAAGDKFGLFRSAGGTFTAQYYRSGSWNIMHIFTPTSTAVLYPSVEGTLETCIVTNPMASANLT